MTTVNNTAPVVAPVADVVAPVADVVAPVADVVAPVVDVAAAMADVAAPVVDVAAAMAAVAPVADVVAPVADVAAPVVAPVAKKTFDVPAMIESDTDLNHDELREAVMEFKSGLARMLETSNNASIGNWLKGTGKLPDNYLEVVAAKTDTALVTIMVPTSELETFDAIYSEYNTTAIDAFKTLLAEDANKKNANKIAKEAEAVAKREAKAAAKLVKEAETAAKREAKAAAKLVKDAEAAVKKEEKAAAKLAKEIAAAATITAPVTDPIGATKDIDAAMAQADSIIAPATVTAPDAVDISALVAE